MGMKYYRVYFKLSNPSPNLKVGGEEFKQLVASSNSALVSEYDANLATELKTKKLGRAPFWLLSDAIQAAFTMKYGVKASYITASDNVPLDINGNPWEEEKVAV